MDGAAPVSVIPTRDLSGFERNHVDLGAGFPKFLQRHLEFRLFVDCSPMRPRQALEFSGLLECKPRRERENRRDDSGRSSHKTTVA